MSEARRPKRVAETIKKHIAEALTRNLQDPRLAGLLVTRVEIGADLALARVFVRTLAGAADAATQKRIEAAANGAAPLLRVGLGEQLALRRVPELRFNYDKGQDAVDRIEELLGEIRSEGTSKP
ncbi:MAG: 30S ribosome-binding factor RbfA [Polyangiaceae bacterium]